MNADTQLASRGRPSRESSRSVADDILAAAETYLARYYPATMSVRELAKLANTNPAMIRYYFGSKDGLVIELLHRYFRQLNEGLNSLASTPDAVIAADPTYALIKTIVSHYAAMPALNSIVATELRRETSRIKTYYSENWPSTIKHFMGDFLQRMIALGVYREEIEPDRVVEMIRGIIFFPLITRPYSDLVGSEEDFFVDEDWLRFVVDVLDRYLRTEMPNDG